MCAERQELVGRLSAALEELSAAVREARERRLNPSPAATAEDRSAAVRTECERIWIELQDHQARHKCYR